MSLGATCDLCGADLLGLETRYVLTMELAQAYDPMEVTAGDLRRDLRGELEALVRTMEKLTAAEAKRLEEEVYSSFRFDVCPACASVLREDAARIVRASGGTLRLQREGEAGRSVP